MEIMYVFKRISQRLKISFRSIETRFWEFCNYSCIEYEYKQSISENLIREIKKMPEIQIIAKSFQLEIKDVPYIVLAYQYHAITLIKDIRSITMRADLLHKIIGLDVFDRKIWKQNNQIPD